MKLISSVYTHFLLIFFCWSFSSQTHYQAVVIVPVVNATGQPLMTLEDNTRMPWCGGQQNRLQSCPRMHQLLFNELVTVVKEYTSPKGFEQVLVEIPTLFFISEQHKEPQNKVWIPKNAIRPLQTIVHNSMIPQPVLNNITNDQPAGAGLRVPVYDKITKKTYSAGTRFVVAPKKSKKHVYVYVFDPDSNTFFTRALTKEHVLIPETTTVQKITQYVDVLRTWAHLPQGHIPYVWGGCSFSGPITQPYYHQETLKAFAHSCYTADDLTYPVTGFDCSNMILRAAQLAGLPYYFKNTYTIMHKAPTLQPKTHVRNGDLIVVQGHVMVISDIEKNLLIEARGYDHGYGKLHEVPLQNVFKDIVTYQDLEQAYWTGKKLERLDRNGRVRDIFSTFVLVPFKDICREVQTL